MSVRAHRIIKVKIEESYDSFNLWQEKKLADFLDQESNFFSQLNDDNNGVTSILVEVLEKAVEQADELELDADTVENLKKDIEWAKANNEEVVQYYCY
jgi:methyl-accepting chemotaxis protein